MEERYSFKFGFNFQIQRLSKMLRSKSHWDESRIKNCYKRNDDFLLRNDA